MSPISPRRGSPIGKKSDQVKSGQKLKLALQNFGKDSSDESFESPSPETSKA